MTKTKENILLDLLSREREARKLAETILEKKSAELYEANLRLNESNKNLSRLLENKNIELSSLFESMEDGYFLVDLFGGILKFNQSANDFFLLEELNISNINTFIYEDDRYKFHRDYLRLLSKGFLRSIQTRVYRPDNSISWIECTLNLIQDNKAEDTFILCVFRDITQAKQKQAIFDAQKNELKAIFDNSSLGIVLSKNSGFLRVNAAFQSFIGYDMEELSKMTFFDVTLPEDREESKLYSERLNKGLIESFSINKRYQTKFGDVFWARTSVAGIFDQEGVLQYQVALIENITDELQNEMLLKGVNSLLSNIIGIHSINGLAKEVCKGCSMFLGIEKSSFLWVDYDKEELVVLASSKKPISKVKKTANSINESIDRVVIATKESYIFDAKDLKQMRSINSKISVPIVVEGDVVALITSENKQKQFFTIDHRETMETIAGLIAVQIKSIMNLESIKRINIENEALLADLKLSNRELKDFAYVVSHDLKSPLRSMNTLINWIEEELPSEAKSKTDKNIALLLSKLDRMDQLIDGLLKYASIDREDQSNSLVDLNDILMEVRELVEIPNHIIFTVKSTLPEVKMSRIHAKQVLQNLISNAVKYCDEVSGLIEIDYKFENQDHIVSIRDNGRGIESKYFKKIFQIFQSLETHEDSTGIGLSIVKKIMDHYNGDVWVNSIVGKGSIFYIRIKDDR